MKPILFNTEMVRAILDGRKTVTRRVIKNLLGETECSHGGEHKFILDNFARREIPTGFVCRKCGLGVSPPHSRRGVGNSWIVPPYFPGDILYVRETWARASDWVDVDPEVGLPNGWIYKADWDGTEAPKWHPSIHMPKEAARIFLRVTGVRVERLQDIITGDYKTPLNINREGLIAPCSSCAHHNGDCKDFIADHTCRLVNAYIDLWNSTVKKSDLAKYGWDANPWVTVNEFERISREEMVKNE